MRCNSKMHILLMQSTENQILGHAFKINTAKRLWLSHQVSDDQHIGRKLS